MNTRVRAIADYYERNGGQLVLVSLVALAPNEQLKASRVFDSQTMRFTRSLAKRSERIEDYRPL